jgi:hypothetical protein
MIVCVIAYSRSKAVVEAFWSILLANPTHLRNMLVGFMLEVVSLLTIECRLGAHRGQDDLGARKAPGRVREL